MTTASTVTKTVVYNGVEIRRSSEFTNSNAYVNRKPLQWIVDGHASVGVFKTLKQAQQYIDDTIKAEATNAYSDWSGNYFIVRPIDGKFTQIAISRDEFKAIKKASK
ncbi:hypothetical protein UFOVP526_49 [uncultured Caudovirales phage]|uniref:Uncharacterized protein n=1 Tax=uncultured Caudovirales phage TaxID=2100421 RepID=A0A6J5MW00_9CAUD|nr:hypothetical protein UFOVP526_49 [uncultured Caudovirales phage]